MIPSGGPILGGLRRKISSDLRERRSKLDAGNPSEINILGYKLMRNILQRNHLIKQKCVIYSISSYHGSFFTVTLLNVAPKI